MPLSLLRLLLSLSLPSLLLPFLLPKTGFGVPIDSLQEIVYKKPARSLRNRAPYLWDTSDLQGETWSLLDLQEAPLREWRAVEGKERP
jgi:chemotaxis signal transduction protein